MSHFSNKNKNNHIRTRRAFSLIEVLLVLTIVAIATAISLAVANNSNKNKKDLELAAREVAQVVRQMQNNAMGGKLPIPGDNTSFACGYVFAYGVNISGKTGYRTGYAPKIVANPCQNGDPLAMNGGAGGTVLKNGAYFDIGSDRSVYFSLPRGDVYRDNGYNNGSPTAPLNAGSKLNAGQVIPITLGSTRTGALRIDVCVYASGRVEEKPIRSGGADSC